ncbi:MAG: NADH-quinone oxidoreductase subunit NuoG [Acidimicrobiaceae bacterium]|nr:NADH-quinone oxidoreductase subunit NuoG [Acidimicrobiaceae bacterium]MYD07167.1 NADH-quinone oxidoreductase subunit NuoG [Acidimicrobiaceae bacterium]MYI59439.1 NADH-quinone oxidoreductase subunit NuoG [Acidimicrobiaceae bacterium]
MTDVSTVSVTVNGREIQAHPDELLIDACERNGTYIPRFCHHPRMNPVGMCRMCLVEVDTGRGSSLQPSCMVPVSDNMVVETETEVAKKAQDGVLEFLLINHPLDCPVCDKGGECPLQDQTMAYGPGESRFIEEKRHFEKPIPISDTVYLDRERCILCDRCTRFADEVAGDALIHFMDRGSNTEVNTFPDEPFASYFSGNTVQICPVGALTAKPYRFKARPWDLEETISTAWTDSVGSRITVQSSRNQVLRVLGVDADPVNWGWLSDKERFAFEALNSESRLVAPMVRSDGQLETVGWGVAFDRVVAALDGVDPNRVAVIGGARLNNEAQYAWAKLAKGVIGTDHVDAQLGDGLGAEVVLGLPRATIDDACRGGGTIILCGPDPKEDLGALYLRLRHAVVQDGATLIELTPQRTGLSNIATHSLHPRPGEVGELAAALVAAATNPDPTDAPAGSGYAQREQSGTGPAGSGYARRLQRAARDISGPVTVVLGRSSLSESAAATVDAAVALSALDDVSFLSALRRGNVHGALDAGLAPGLLPGRTTLERGAHRFVDAWPSVPENVGHDTAGILRAARAGEIDTLILLGADPLNDFPDAELAREGMAGAGTVIAVDLLPNDTIMAEADVILAAAGPTESSGTFTNLEGRVSVCGQIVTAAGISRPDWMIAAEIAIRLGSDLGVDSPAAIRAELASFSEIHAPLTEQALDDSQVDGVLLSGNGDIAPPEPAGATSPVNDRYSLRLLATRRMYDDGTALRHSPASSGHASSLELRLNPVDFDKIGVQEGTVVRVESARGHLDMPVQVDVGVPVGSAAVPWRTLGADCRPLIDASAVVTDVRVERL